MKLNFTVYTDGACSGNPGQGGYCGIILCEELGLTKDNFAVVLGSRKSTTNNIMELMAIRDAIKAIKSIDNPQSNLRKLISFMGEVDDNYTDTTSAFDNIKDLNDYDISINIYSDSKYAINCLTVWFEKWIMSDWISSSGEAVKNRELIESILNDMNMNSTTIQFNWLKGHSTNEFNNYCDRLAVHYSKLNDDRDGGIAISSLSDTELDD